MKKGNLSIAFSCAILAFIVTLQLKSVGFHSNRTKVENARNENLQAMLYDEQDKNEVLFNQLEETRQQLEQLQSTIGEPGGEEKVLSDRVKSLELLSGVSAVKGPGITITIEIVPPAAQPEGAAPPAYVIRDEDILSVVNALWSAGAEAVAVNGQRLIASSSFSGENGTVVIDKTPFSAPFTIQAIGNADAMQAAVFARQGIAETLSQWGIKVTAVKAKTIGIPAYKGRIAYEYAVSE